MSQETVIYNITSTVSLHDIKKISFYFWIVFGMFCVFLMSAVCFMVMPKKKCHCRLCNSKQYTQNTYIPPLTNTESTSPSITRKECVFLSEPFLDIVSEESYNENQVELVVDEEEIGIDSLSLTNSSNDSVEL